MRQIDNVCIESVDTIINFALYLGLAHLLVDAYSIPIWPLFLGGIIPVWFICSLEELHLIIGSSILYTYIPDFHTNPKEMLC